MKPMKPMLAAATDGKDLSYPLLLSPKLDGVRCLIIDGVVASRSLKPIPNRHVQRVLGKSALSGLDGELIVGPPNGRDVYRRTMSAVMSADGEPQVCFYVFDDYDAPGGFRERLDTVYRRIAPCKTRAPLAVVEHQMIYDEVDLLNLEEDYLADGFEGVMLRHPGAPYKHGRSTPKEGWLLKLKRFTDSEAVILGAVAQLRNTNVARRNAVGRTERSSHKAGKQPTELLGALTVQDVGTGVEFDVGTGFTAQERKALWPQRGELPGRLIKYKSQSVGVKDKPRFPVFLGFRDGRDT